MVRRLWARMTGQERRGKDRGLLFPRTHAVQADICSSDRTLRSGRTSAVQTEHCGRAGLLIKSATSFRATTTLQLVFSLSFKDPKQSPQTVRPGSRPMRMRCSRSRAYRRRNGRRERRRALTPHAGFHTIRTNAAIGNSVAMIPQTRHCFERRSYSFQSIESDAASVASFFCTGDTRVMKTAAEST